MAVINLDRERPDAATFVRRIRAEMKIRFYQRKSMDGYEQALGRFLRWYEGAPHQVRREDVREYLEFLVDGGAGSSWVAMNLSALRTAFDKMCRRTVTLGLVTPRRPKRLPVILSESEVVRLLEAAPSLRDKLLLGTMYATGLRVGEAVRLRWRDLDFERRTLRVWQGKGRKDRMVMLPASFVPLLDKLRFATKSEDFLFPSQNRGRHLSPVTAGRVMERAAAIAGLTKKVTCHSLRHAFATHLLEHGTDIRFIQQLLGHAKLETTRLYTHVAVLRNERVESPIDRLMQPSAGPRELPAATARRPVGRMRLEVQRSSAAAARAVIVILSDTAPVRLDGVVVKEARPGWVTIDLPPLESWSEQMRWLTPEQRERLTEPAFYETLRLELAKRLAVLASRAG